MKNKVNEYVILLKFLVREKWYRNRGEKNIGCFIFD